MLKTRGASITGGILAMERLQVGAEAGFWVLVAVQHLHQILDVQNGQLEGLDLRKMERRSCGTPLGFQEVVR